MWELVAKIGLATLEMFITDQKRRADMQKRWLDSVQKVNGSALDSANLRQRYDEICKAQDERLKGKK